MEIDQNEDKDQTTSKRFITIFLFDIDTEKSYMF